MRLLPLLLLACALSHGFLTSSSCRSSRALRIASRSSSSTDGSEPDASIELNPYELRGQYAPKAAELNPFQLREQAKTKAMLAEIDGDPDLKALLADSRIKGLIILLRNLNPGEMRQVFDEQYGDDKFVQSAKGRIFALMDKYR
jgi:hypothetical protein